MAGTTAASRSAAGRVDNTRYAESMKTRRVLPALTFVAAMAISGGFIAAAPAKAEDWPTRPMTMVAPFAAGGSTDAIARIVAEGLSSQLNQPVIVENVGGAGGMTGANRVAKAPP